MLSLIIIIILFLFLIFYISSVRNRLNSVIQECIEHLTYINKLVEQRHIALESFINAVNSYIDIKQTSFKDIVNIIADAKDADTADSFSEKIRLENLIEQSIITHIRNVMLASTTLKKSRNAQQLMREVIEINNKFTKAKAPYNESIVYYDKLKKSFVESILVGYFEHLNKSFTPWPEN